MTCVHVCVVAHSFRSEEEILLYLLVFCVTYQFINFWFYYFLLCGNHVIKAIRYLRRYTLYSTPSRTLLLTYCSFRLTKGRIYRINQSQPIITSHILLSRDFPPFILNYPPPKPLQTLLGGLLKLSGLRGGERDADSHCKLPASVCWTVFFRKCNDLCTCLMLYFVIFVLFYFCTTLFFFSSNVLRRHCLCCLGGNSLGLFSLKEKIMAKNTIIFCVRDMGVERDQK